MRVSVLFVALLVAAGVGSGPVSAQTQRNQVPPPTGDLPATFTYAEFQGLACLVGGTMAAVGVATYSELITAATGGAAIPVIVPIVAAGFAAGCSVGSTMSPGLLWIYRRIHGVDPTMIGRGSSAASLER